MVFYPFHPLHGYRLRVLRRPAKSDSAVTVVDPIGKRLKIPTWMLLPEASRAEIASGAYLSRDSLLSLVQCLNPPETEIAITFCQRLRMPARGIVMLQLQLLSLVRTEEELVAVDAAGRAKLLDVMARILITVFHAQEREKDERASIQSENQARALDPKSNRLLAPIE